VDPAAGEGRPEIGSELSGAAVRPWSSPGAHPDLHGLAVPQAHLGIARSSPPSRRADHPGIISILDHRDHHGGDRLAPHHRRVLAERHHRVYDRIRENLHGRRKESFARSSTSASTRP